MNRHWLLGLSLVWVTGPAWAGGDTLRCASNLISVGDRIGEVLQKCGQPLARDPLGYRRSADRRDEFQVEEWTYGPNSGMYYYLRFEGNRLVQITSKRGN